MIQQLLNLKHSGKVIILAAGLLCWLFVAGVASEDGHDDHPEPHDSTTVVDEHAGHDHGEEDEHAGPVDNHEGDGHENCDGDHSEEAVEAHDDHDEHGAMVQMSKSELDEFGVMVDIAGSGPLEITV